MADANDCTAVIDGTVTVMAGGRVDEGEASMRGGNGSRMGGRPDDDGVNVDCYVLLVTDSQPKLQRWNTQHYVDAASGTWDDMAVSLHSGVANGSFRELLPVCVRARSVSALGPQPSALSSQLSQLSCCALLCGSLPQLPLTSLLTPDRCYPPRRHPRKGSLLLWPHPPRWSLRSIAPHAVALQNAPTEKLLVVLAAVSAATSSLLLSA